jgi:ABC-type proline/glycine betaine transport system substrate-binding protein
MILLSGIDVLAQHLIVQIQSLMNFPVSTVEIYVSKKIMDNDTVMDYLGKRGMTSGQISGILAAADADQLSPEEAAEYILKRKRRPMGKYGFF